jgi:hypothetical protein
LTSCQATTPFGSSIDKTSHQANCPVSTAYWIAFGSHGPRALPPPGEGKKIAAYTFAGLFASFVLFASIRSFANPPPPTMTKEWQEASNEYLKVRLPHPKSTVTATNLKSTGPKLGPPYWYLLGGVHWQGPGPVALWQTINRAAFLCR